METQFVAFQLLAQALLYHSENRAWRVLGIYSPPPNQVTIAVGGLGKGVGLGRWHSNIQKKITAQQQTRLQ